MKKLLVNYNMDSLNRIEAKVYFVFAKYAYCINISFFYFKITFLKKIYFYLSIQNIIKHKTNFQLQIHKNFLTIAIKIQKQEKNYLNKNEF